MGLTANMFYFYNSQKFSKTEHAHEQTKQKGIRDDIKIAGKFTGNSLSLHCKDKSEK